MEVNGVALREVLKMGETLYLGSRPLSPNLLDTYDFTRVPVLYKSDKIKEELNSAQFGFLSGCKLESLGYLTPSPRQFLDPSGTKLRLTATQIILSKPIGTTPESCAIPDDAYGALVWIVQQSGVMESTVHYFLNRNISIPDMYITVIVAGGVEIYLPTVDTNP